MSKQFVRIGGRIISRNAIVEVLDMGDRPTTAASTVRVIVVRLVTGERFTIGGAKATSVWDAVTADTEVWAEPTDLVTLPTHVVVNGVTV